ncbi:MAG TPA: hypothetical protein VER55_06465 [Ardenticatenaceae bacterium]|nr:hypothetical protein [Ardenticatenaceae bacterium]
MDWLFFLGSAAIAVLIVAAWQRMSGSRAATPPAAGPAVDLVRVAMRTECDSVLWQIEGRWYRHLDEIEDHSHRALAVSVIHQLLDQLPAEAGSPAAPPAPALPMPETRPEVEAPAYTARPPVAPRAVPTPSPLDSDFDEPFWKRFKESFLGPSPSVTVAPIRVTTSAPMLAEINDLFQENLRALPEAPSASVRPALGGGMEILVGGRLYESVDAIPSVDVADALRRAVKTWEAQG